jgi:hypothetical protein
MAHCHCNQPYQCLVCGGSIRYGDEAPPDFCSELCETEFEKNWKVCRSCGVEFKKWDRIETDLCSSCLDDLPEGTDYDERDQT